MAVNYGEYMYIKNITARTISAVLVLALIFSAIALFSGAVKITPEDTAPDEVFLEKQQIEGNNDGTGAEQSENAMEMPRNDAIQEELPEEEDSPEEAPPELPKVPKESQPEQAGENEDAETEKQEADGEETEPGGEITETDDSDEGTGEGKGMADDENEYLIATDLTLYKIVSQTELEDGVLRFYAYGTGADDLSVKVRVKNASEDSNGKILPSLNGKDYSYQLELGEKYRFIVYLYKGGKQVSYAQYSVTYQAKRASADEPTVGDYPPFITTNIDQYEDGCIIEGDNLPLIVTVRTNPDYKVVTADKMMVTLNGVPVEKHTGDSSPEYDLFFEPPNKGDYREYKIEIIAWYGNNSRYWSKTLQYHAVGEGDKVGSVTIVLDATTVGLGILDSDTYEIVKSNTAADVFLKFLNEYGYEATYTGNTKNNFYLRRVERAGLCYGASVPEKLWSMILRDGITLNEDTYYEDSLGEFDYTMGSGWTYAVNGSYPGRALSAYEMRDRDVIYVRFTLCYGKDIGSYDASGGGYGRLNGYCGYWMNGTFVQLEHDYAEAEHIEPGETEDGYIKYICSKCGEEMIENLPVAGKIDSEIPEEQQDPEEPTESENTENGELQ